MDRIYDGVVAEHFAHETEILFLSGARQVGKTTVSQNVAHKFERYVYLNWDHEDHQALLADGPDQVKNHIGLHMLSEHKPVLALDEVHKRPGWKNYLKGLYDTVGANLHIIVTGSARLDIYQKGGDSLMGRYFNYRMHPLSVAECQDTQLIASEVRSPKQLSEDIFEALYQFGGYPKPFLRQQVAFSNRWHSMRKKQLLYEDIRDLNVIHDMNRLSLLMNLLEHRAAQQLSYSGLASHVKAATDTIIRWIETLEAFYYCFRVQPWSHNIARALIKEPKIFLCDWSHLDDPGARAENFIAIHLKKAVEFWSDAGFGQYGLYYIRTRDKKEIDFVVTKNNKPWFLVEVKSSSKHHLNPNLAKFQAITGAQHAFQVAVDMPYVDVDCFSQTEPVIVPARTFLSQLI